MKLPRLALTLLALVAVTTACSWAVPAHPGRNARLRAAPVPEEAATVAAPSVAGSASDDGTARVYAERCSRCHAPFAPSAFSAEEWPSILVKYGPRAGLVGAERSRVLAWLQAHAR